MRRWHSNSKPVKWRLAAQARWFTFMGDALANGMSLQQALQFTERFFPDLSVIWSAVATELATGQSLATALKPWIRIDLYYQLQLAESHGSLHQTIHQVGQYLTQQVRQQRKLRGLLQYPLLLLVMLGGFGVVMGRMIWPQIQSLQVTTPPSWPQIISVQGLITTASASGTIIVIQGIRYYRMTRLQRINWLCHQPLIGRYLRLYWQYYLVSNLAMMLSQGMSWQEMTRLAQQYHPESILHQTFATLESQVAQGQSLAQVIERSGYLPNELAAFLGRGLTVGALGHELEVYGQVLFRQFLTRTEQLLELVQPILFIVVAIMIGGMYLSLLLPLYHSLQAVN